MEHYESGDLQLAEHAGRGILAAAKTLATENPGKTVTVTVTANVYHTPSQSPDILLWMVQIGHSDSERGDTLAGALAAIKYAGSPEAKRKKAAEMRRHAALLEESAQSQPPAPTQSHNG